MNKRVCVWLDGDSGILENHIFLIFQFYVLFEIKWQILKKIFAVNLTYLISLE